MKYKYTYLSIRQIALLAISALLAGCTSREYTQASGLGWVDFAVATAETTPFLMDSPSYSLTVSSADGLYSHTWPTLSDYPKYEPYTIGRYHARAVSGSPDAEGYDCPCYLGEADFEVMESKHSTIGIECGLVQSVINISFGQTLAAKSPAATVTAHSSGHGYVSADTNNDRPIYLLPGTTYLYITLEDAAGRKATIAPDFSIDAEAAKIYDISVDMDAENALEVRCGSVYSKTPISEELFDSAEPAIEDVGFTSGDVLNIVEGFPAETPIKMLVSAPAGLSAAILTIVSDNDRLPSECDILDTNALSSMKYLDVERIDDANLVVDFTRLLENVGVLNNSYLTFLLQARDRLNRVSQASILRVAIRSVDLELASRAYNMVGTNVASIDVALTSPEYMCGDFKIFILDDAGNIAKDAAILSYSEDSSSKIAHIEFEIDPGLENVPIRVDFMGNPKLFTYVERRVPKYDIFVDAFALTANIYVTTSDEALREMVILNATPKANGANATVLDRDVEAGCITISQLSPSTAYEIATVLIPGKYVPSMKATTEKSEQVPSGDFEDFEDLLQQKRLPCGGKYSNTVFPIYNMQNYIDIDVKWPQKHWASTNAKTFCKAAKRQNTWYMHPSALLDFDMSASGSKSIQMQSVGWSLDGPEIAPYKQTDDKTELEYNANVPEVAHRSAGRVFLGTYKFDPSTMSEVYDEGVAFSSRPRSLNGFYQYISDVSSNDNGVVAIELINDSGEEPVSVASASMRFPSSPGFTSFNLPLTYHAIGVKATRLRIMFASSYHYGNIQDEDEEVPTTADASKGMYIGSTLRVDNLSFSY